MTSNRIFGKNLMLLIFSFTAMGLFGQDPCKDVPASSALSTTNIGYYSAQFNIAAVADGYYARYKKSGSNSWTNIYSLDGGSSLSFGLNTLEMGTQYEWQVALAFGDLQPGGVNCLSPYSALQSFTTLSCITPDGNDIQIGLQDVSSPLLFAYTAQGDGYEFRYKASNAANYTYTSYLETPFYAFNGWVGSTTYQVSFRIRCSQDGDKVWSDWSNDKFFTTPLVATCTTPTPAQMVTDRIDYTSAILSINASADRYNFRYRPKGGALIESGFQDGKSLVLSGLDADKAYDWQVQLLCAQTVSDWSDAVTFRTLACPQPDFHHLDVINRAEEALTVLISSIQTAETYQWRYREKGTNAWTEAPVTTSTQWTISPLKSGAVYEIQCRLGCSEKYQVYSDWSSSIEGETISSGCPTPKLQDFEVVTSSYTKALVQSRIQADAYMFQYTRAAFPGSYTPTDAMAEPSIELVRLASDEEYLLQMRVKCNNIWSDWSADLQFRTAACPDLFPGALQAEIAGPGSLTLAIRQQGNYESYEWQYKPSLIGTTTQYETSRRPGITISGLFTGYNYTWSARASCPERLNEVFWTAWTAGPNIVTFCEPARQSDIFADRITETSARLNCLLTQFSVFEFRYRVANTSIWKEAPAISVATYADIFNLTPDTQYEFQVKFDCADNQSDWSPSQTFKTRKTEEPCKAPALEEIFAEEITSNAAKLRCLAGNATSYAFRYKRERSTQWTDAGMSNNGVIHLSGLLEDEKYELQCRLTCGTDISDWSRSYYFQTAMGACDGPAPGDLVLADLTDSSAQFRCTLPATAYQFRYKALNDTDWKFVNAQQDGLAYSRRLEAFTAYEVQCRIPCDSGNSPWSPSLQFTTKRKIEDPGGNDPVITDPCNAPDTSEIFITDQGVGGVMFSTSYYSDRGYQFRVRSSDDDEWMVFVPTKNPGMTTNGLKPSTNYFVSLRAGCSQGISDWSARKGFITTGDCKAPTSQELDIHQEGDLLTISFAAANAEGFQFRFKLRGDTAWQVQAASKDGTLVVSNVPGDTVIQFQVRISCGIQSSAWSDLFSYRTEKANAVSYLTDDEWSIFPNPAHDRVGVRFENGKDAVQLSWWSMDGRIYPGQSILNQSGGQINTPSVPGLYILRLVNGNKVGLKKVVIY